jgi:hypothetical protein
MKRTIFSVIILLALLSAGCTKGTGNGTMDVPSCSWTTLFADDFHRYDTIIGSNFNVIIQPVIPGGHGFAGIYHDSLRISSDSVYWAVVYAKDVDDSKTRVSVECTTPSSGGTIAFGVGGKFTNAGTAGQTGYLAAYIKNGLAIYKLASGGMTTLASQNFPVEFNKTYKIVFAINNRDLSATISDQASGASVTVTAADPGTILSGKQYSINGNSLGGQVTLLFSNFLIEACR